MSKSPKYIRDLKNINITFRAPEHFYNGIIERAKSYDMRMSEYVTACVIADMRNDAVSKELKRANEKRVIPQIFLYPTVKKDI